MGKLGFTGASNLLLPLAALGESEGIVEGEGFDETQAENAATALMHDKSSFAINLGFGAYYNL